MRSQKLLAAQRFFKTIQFEDLKFNIRPDPTLNSLFSFFLTPPLQKRSSPSRFFLLTEGLELASRPRALSRIVPSYFVGFETRESVVGRETRSGPSTDYQTHRLWNCKKDTRWIKYCFHEIVNKKLYSVIENRSKTKQTAMRTKSQSYIKIHRCIWPKAREIGCDQVAVGLIFLLIG